MIIIEPAYDRTEIMHHDQAGLRTPQGFYIPRAPRIGTFQIHLPRFNNFSLRSVRSIRCALAGRTGDVFLHLITTVSGKLRGGTERIMFGPHVVSRG